MANALHCQALHAVVCVRTDRRDEALALCRRVADQRPPPTDDAVLSTLAHVYRATDARTYASVRVWGGVVDEL